MKKNTSWKFTDESSVTFQLSVSGPGEFGLGIYSALVATFLLLYLGIRVYHHHTYVICFLRQQASFLTIYVTLEWKKTILVKNTKSRGRFWMSLAQTDLSKYSLF